MATEKIRVRLCAFDVKLIDQSAQSIVQAVQKAGAKVLGPIPLPTRINKVTVLRSPHVNKKSREQFEMRTHKRLIDIIEKYKNLYSPENPSSTVEANWAAHALGVLAQIKGKTEKEYCISIAKDESLHWILRTRAISTFIVNYDSSDGDLIRELYHRYTHFVNRKSYVNFTERGFL